LGSVSKALRFANVAAKKEVEKGDRAVCGEKQERTSHLTYAEKACIDNWSKWQLVF
jgi:hypothetical protein